MRLFTRESLERFLRQSWPFLPAFLIGPLLRVYQLRNPPHRLAGLLAMAAVVQLLALARMSRAFARAGSTRSSSTKTCELSSYGQPLFVDDQIVIF